MLGLVVGPQDQCRPDDRGRRERLVRRRDGRDVAQPRVVLRGEPRRLVRGYDQRLITECHALQRLRRRLVQSGQPQPAVGIHHAMTRRSNERHGPCRGAVDPKHGLDSEIARLVDRDVQAQLRRGVRRHILLWPRLHQLHPDSARFVQQRPQLRGFKSQQRDRLHVPVRITPVRIAVVASRIRARRPVGRIELLQQPKLSVGITAVAQHVQLAPAQIAGHPAAALSGPHEPRVESRRRPAHRQAQLDRQWCPDAIVRRGRGKQRVQRLPPRRGAAEAA